MTDGDPVVRSIPVTRWVGKTLVGNQPEYERDGFGVQTVDRAERILEGPDPSDTPNEALFYFNQLEGN